MRRAMRIKRLLYLVLVGVAAGWLPLVAEQSPAAPCESELCKSIASGRLNDLRGPDFSDQLSNVQRFYASAEFQFAWTRNGAITDAAYKVIQLFTEADHKGLNPEDYDASRWEARIRKLQEATPTPSELAEFDLALTVNALRYVSHLHFGRANPNWIHGASGLRHEDADIAGIVRELLLPGANVRGKIEAIEPPYESYHQTEKALQKYLEWAHEKPEEPLPVTSKPLDPKSPYPALRQLATKLHKLGDLPESEQVPEDVYSGPLVEAVKHFQARHGLDTDGRIGKATFAALNTPYEQRIQQLQLTLERWRWVPHRFPRPPIVVNIPEFDLRALNDSYTTGLEMKVVVGKAYRTETPVFAAELKSIGFRPYWNVPWSIQRKELVPKIVADNEYLLKNNYEVVTPRNEVVTDGTVDDSILLQLRTGKLRLRQRPGPENALGLIKFDFPNPYDVYMHDTPAPMLFSKSRRDFSHGCIRVEKPLQLAEWVLRGQGDWTTEKIMEAMQGEKTFEVPIARPFPVFIVYSTGVVTSMGEEHFFDDIYGEDARLAALLAGGPPYTSKAATSGAPGPRPRE